MNTKIFIYENKIIINSKNDYLLGFSGEEELKKLINIIFDNLSFGEISTFRVNLYELQKEILMNIQEDRFYSNTVDEDNVETCDLAIYEDYVDIVNEYISSIGYIKVTPSLNLN